jgi:hypothetical protein
MKQLIEVKIENKGHMLGTLGWFNEIMNKSEFVIKETTEGTPAMFLKTTDDDGKVKYSFLCKKFSDNKDPFGFRLTSDYYLCKIAESHGYVTGLFNFPLTPACKKAVEEMIMRAKDAFKEWFESDSEVESRRINFIG